MADEYLRDYSNISAIGGAAKGFMDAWKAGAEHNDLEADKKMKQQESEARMASEKAKMDREAAQTAIENRRQDYKQAQDLAERNVKLGAQGQHVDEQGNMTNIALSPYQQSQENLKGFGIGAKPGARDEFGNPKEWVANPETPAYMGAKTKQQMAVNTVDTREQNQAMKQDRLDLSHDALDQRIHERVLSRIASDPALHQKMNQYQGLSNSLSVVANADHLTPEQIQEFQQGIRANMGMKGTGGIEEREATQFKTLGLNSAKFKEFLTGDPAELAKDSNLVKHLQQLAQIEQSNIKDQYQKALNAAAGGHASLYKRRDDLKSDLEDAINVRTQQFEAPAVAPESAPAPSTPPPPQGGLVKPQGLVGKIAGKLGSMVGSSASATPAAHPQDAAAVQWAQSALKANPNDPRAIAILKANGL